jgi:hypothetical protein
MSSAITPIEGSDQSGPSSLRRGDEAPFKKAKVLEVTKIWLCVPKRLENSLNCLANSKTSNFTSRYGYYVLHYIDSGFNKFPEMIQLSKYFLSS